MPTPLPMPTLTMVLGFLLVVLGLSTFFISDTESFTPLIPAAMGIAFLLFGLVAVSGIAVKLMMHMAVAIAVLAGLGALGRVVTILGNDASAMALASQFITAGLLLGYVTLGVISFLQVRRLRKAGRNTAATAADARG